MPTDEIIWRMIPVLVAVVMPLVLFVATGRRKEFDEMGADISKTLRDLQALALSVKSIEGSVNTLNAGIPGMIAAELRTVTDGIYSRLNEHGEAIARHASQINDLSARRTAAELRERDK